MKNKFIFFLTIYLTLSSPSFANIKILNPWVSASTGPNASLFMEIENTGNKPDKLIAVKAIQTTFTEFHNHREKGNGMLQIGKIDYIEIPAQGYTQLKPGGEHVSFREIREPFHAGSIVKVSLDFQNGETVQVNAPVRAVGATD